MNQRRNARRTARCRWLLLPIIVLAALAGSARQAQPADAFKLYVHKDILQKALSDKMSANALSSVEGHWNIYMVWGTGNQSSDQASGQAHDYLHFDSAKDPTDLCERWKDGVDEPLRRAVYWTVLFVRYADATGGNTGSRDYIAANALEAFGTVTHAVEDFYAHSNWVEYWQPSRIAADTPFRTAPILGTSCNPGDFPSQVHTGYASLATYLANVANYLYPSWCPWSDNPKPLVGPPGHIVLPAGYTDCHDTLAKDENAGHGADKLSDLGVAHVGWTLEDGTAVDTLFDAAKQLAIQSTAEAWQVFVSRAKAAITSNPGLQSLNVNADCVIKKLAYGPSAESCINTSCPGWNVAGTWTLYLGPSSNAGPPSRPTLELTQNGTTISGTVTADPDAAAGQSKAGTKFGGTISGSAITLNLPWYPMVPYSASDTLQAFTGTVSSSSQIQGGDSFYGWTMSGQATPCSSRVPSGGMDAGGFHGDARLQALPSYLDAGVLDGVVTPANRIGGTPPPAKPDWTVPFKTSRGLIQLTPSGDTVTGSYDQGKGQIIAVARDTVLKGAWFHAPTYLPPNDAGDFEFLLSDDNSSFSGRYSSAADGQWHTDWTGSKTTGSAASGPPPAPGGPWPGASAGTASGGTSANAGSTSGSSSGSTTTGSSGGSAGTGTVTDVPSCVRFVQGVGLSAADAASACQAIASTVPPGSSFGAVFSCVYGKISGGVAPATALSGCTASSGGTPSGSSSGSAGGCGQWNVTGTWQLVQSNNYRPTLNVQQSGSAITGTVTLSTDDQARGNYVTNSGTLTGTLTGNQIQFTTSQMAKRDGSASQARYTGTVSQGQISNGQAQDLLHPGSTATWTATGPAACAGAGGSAGSGGSAAGVSPNTPASQPSSPSGSGSGSGGNGACLDIVILDICFQP